jgi:hypothetical protein
MRIDPPKEAAGRFNGLTPLEQKTRKVSIAVAFVGVFVWAVKILFL